MACCVFASVFILLPLLFFFAYLLGLCLCCPRLVLLPALFVLVSLGVFVSCCGCVVGFSFSLTDYVQKRKGAKVLPLASSLVLLCVFIFLCSC